MSRKEPADTILKHIHEYTVGFTDHVSWAFRCEEPGCHVWNDSTASAERAADYAKSLGFRVRGGKLFCKMHQP